MNALRRFVMICGIIAPNRTAAIQAAADLRLKLFKDGYLAADLLGCHISYSSLEDPPNAMRCYNLVFDCALPGKKDRVSPPEAAKDFTEAD